MANVLAEILAHKRAEVEQARRARPLKQLKSRPEYDLPRRDFYGAVTAAGGRRPNLIAEIKRTSPSAGLMRPDLDPVVLAQQYAAGGASALSVLTDERYFGGRLEHIAQVKASVSLPVLRKDFLLDPYQVHESRAAGADAVLVIAEALDAGMLAELVTLARDLELWVLLEVHTRRSLRTAIQLVHDRRLEGVLLGVNNRDLQTQRVDLATTEELARLVPSGLPFVAESGICTPSDMRRMRAAGAQAVLVGEALLRSPDPARAIRELHRE